MRIAIGSDHAAYEMKNKIAMWLSGHNYTLEDFSMKDGEKSDYPVIAGLLCNAILNNKCEKGILLCGSGIGMSIAANRNNGIRAALCLNEYMAKTARKHNNANILILPGRILAYEMAIEILHIFLEESFEGGRHEKRLFMIDKKGE